jgi:hypothetical protein
MAGFIVSSSTNESVSLVDKADSDINPVVIEDGKQTVTEIPESLLANEWENIQATVQKTRYYPTWSQGALGYVASNPKHQWSITYDEGAVLVNPSSGEDWFWLLTPTGYGYEKTVVSMNDDPEVFTDDNGIEFVYNQDLTGWYINNENGLEHGFTINAPPQPNSAGNLLFKMSLQTSLIPIYQRGNLLFLDDSGIKILSYGKLSVTDAEGFEIPSELHLSSDHITISVDDTNAKYPLTIDPLLITMIKKIEPSDGEDSHEFGEAVSIHGDTVVIGANNHVVNGNNSQGVVYILQRHQGGSDNWGEVVNFTASDLEEWDSFGISVSISGDTVAVGAYLADTATTSDAGAVYIYERNLGGSDNWGLVKKIVASDPDEQAGFGYCVSIHGDTIVVGASRVDSSPWTDFGAVYIYQRNFGGSDNWGEVKKIMASDGGGADYFGFSVSINDDTLAVGAEGDDNGIYSNQGSAYIFQRDEGGADNWGEVTKMTPSDGGSEDNFGHSISISGDTVVVGSLHETVDGNSDQGSAYIFQRDEGGVDNWGEIAHLIASDGEADDVFGDSVSINGDSVVIGAPGDDFEDEDEGSVYVYNRNQGSGNNWDLIEKITISDGDRFDWFGQAVSIDDRTFIVGAYGDEVNGTSYIGTAYLYDLFNSTHLPTITTSDNKFAEEDSQYYVDYEAHDPDGTPLTWSLWSDTNGWLTINFTTGVLSGTPLNSDVGTWTVNVSVSDSVNGIDFSNFTLTVENTNDAPSIETGNRDSANVDELYSVDYDASDEDPGDTLSWDVDTDAYWLNMDSSSGVLSGIPNDSDVGSFWVNVSVSDGNGGIDYTVFTLSVSNTNDDPVIVTSNIESCLEGELYSVDYDATDNDHDVLSWTLNTYANWLAIDSSSGILSGTPEKDDVGSYSVKVTVSDGKGGSDKTEFTLEVLADSDGDGIADSYDTDDDNDGYTDDIDAFPDDQDEWLDTDGDGIGNNEDSDDDNDGYSDDEDDLPLDDTEWLDTDGDGIGNKADDDDDDDGYDDNEDDFPLDVTEWLDTDFDGIGNNEDTDDDDDGVLDINDKYPLDSTRSKDAEDQESMYMIILLILIIIIAFILILAISQRKKKVEVGAPSVAPIPAQPAIQSSVQTLRCPQCQNRFNAQLPSTIIQCPYCGYSAKMQ